MCVLSVVFDLTGRVAALESRLAVPASNKTEENFDLFDGDEVAQFSVCL